MEVKQEILVGTKFGSLVRGSHTYMQVLNLILEDSNLAVAKVDCQTTSNSTPHQIFGIYGKYYSLLQFQDG